MKAKVFSLVLLLGATLFLFGCGGRTASAPEPQVAAFSPIKVIATFYPVAFLAEQVGGERAEVVSLVPPGAEAHHWEPTARQMSLLQEAQVFVFNGAGMEPWAERLVQLPENQRLIVVEASSGLELLKYIHLPAEQEKKHDHNHRHTKDHDQKEGESLKKDEHHHGEYDPHVWLDPLLTKQMAANIAAGLKQADPEGAAIYQKNLAALQERLNNLHARYQAALHDKAGQAIVTSHAAFGYLTHRYGLVQVPIMGLSPEAEPSPAQMARLVRMVRETGVKFIFSETLANPRIAETLAKEVGAQVLILNPLEGLTKEQELAGEDYFSIMEKNLINLKLGLGVQK
ncbi:MAG: zinc ABC transporter substrate-binding protein [Syntrophomonadaceae bacterium]|nr:zinc ABC transporter substrate-binding protein [Syntrophomonadaceae bacterium]